MVRMARVVVPEYPHHGTQRGVRSLNVFSSDEDRLAYLRLIREQCDRFGLHALSCCLMDNHVHFVVVPERAESLVRAIGEAHASVPAWLIFATGCGASCSKAAFEQMTGPILKPQKPGPKTQDRTKAVLGSCQNGGVGPRKKRAGKKV